MSAIIKLQYICIAFACLLSCCTAHAASLQLSPAEQEWLRIHKTIRMSGPQAFPPFQYVDDQGAYKGMATDYVLHIAQMVGLTVETVPNMPWPEILQQIKNKHIDVLSCAATTQERAAYLRFTDPHLSFPLVIISRKDSSFIADIQGLTQRKVALVEKNVVSDWLEEDNIHVTPVFVSSPLEALRKVALGKAEYAIENLAAASYLIEKHGLTNLKIAAPTSFKNYSLSMAVRDDWPELASILNKGLAALSQETHNTIRQRWISVRYEHGLTITDIIKWVLLVIAIALVLLSGFVYWNRRLAREIRERKKAEREKEKLIETLTTALEEIKTLRGILPICCECKKIRNDEGYWTRIEAYISKHSEANFSHGICPDCVEKLYGHEQWIQKKTLIAQQ